MNSAQPVALLVDRSMLVAPGQVVRTGWIDIDLCVLGCRDPMAVGDVGDKYRELLQRGESAGWPPPRGYWLPNGSRFVIEDGRHEFVAALMHGKRRIFVAWLVPVDGARLPNGSDGEDGA